MHTGRRAWLTIVGIPLAVVPALWATAADTPSNQAEVTVQPPSGTTTAQTGGSGLATFRVFNDGSMSETFALSCDTDGTYVTDCGVATDVTIDAGASKTVDVSFDPGVVGTGSLSLTAFGLFAGEDTGTEPVDVVAPSVSVTAVGTVSDVAPWSGGNDAAFEITNTGVDASTYAITCAGTGAVTCGSASVASLTLGAGAKDTVMGSFAVGASGSGNVTVSASVGGGSDDASHTVTVASSSDVFVGRKGRAANRQPHVQQSETFAVKNTGQVRADFELFPTCGGPAVLAAPCTVLPQSVGLEPGESQEVAVTFRTDAPGMSNGAVSLQAVPGLDTTTTNDGTINDALVVIPPSPSTPVMELSGGTTSYVRNQDVQGAWPSAELTAELLFRHDGVQLGALLSYAYTTSRSNEILIAVKNDDAIDVWIRHQLHVVTGVDVYGDDAWHHVLLRWRSSDGLAEFFIDGALLDSWTVADDSTLGGGGSFVVGQEQDALEGGYDPNQSLVGGADNVRIYNRRVTDTEVAAHAVGQFTDDTGLVLSWDFDDGTATDQSGTGNHGTILGGNVVVMPASPPTPVLELRGGTTSYVRDQTVQGAWPSTDLTAEVLFRHDGVQLGSLVSYAFSTSRSNEILIAVKNDNAIDVGVRHELHTVTGVDVYGDDAWHHALLRWRSSDGLAELFIDGALVDSWTAAAGQTLGGGGSFVVGQEQDALQGGYDATQSLVGAADNVRIYNRRVTDAEVAEHAAAQFTDDTGLVLAWDFDDGSATDRSGANNHGTVNDAAFRVPPPSTPVVDVQGDTTSYVRTQAVQGVWPSTDLTAELLFRHDASQFGGLLSYAYSTARSNEILIGVKNSNAIDIGIRHQLHTVTGVDVYDDGEWHHALLRWRSSDGLAEFFIDGDLADSWTVAAGQSLGGGGSFVVGQEQDALGGGYDPNQALVGAADNVRVYSRRVTDAEVTEHAVGRFTDDAGLVLAWDFDDGTARDRSGSRNLGTGPVEDGATVTVTTVDAGAPVVSIDDANPGLTVDRSRCVTLRAFGTAASQCGDLVVGHALGSIRTLGTVRAPSLLYNSLAADPDRLLVAAWVTRQTGTALPDSVTATLWVGGVEQSEETWPQADWSSAGEARRIALSVDATTHGTGVDDYSLEVAFWEDDAPRATTVTGQYVLVNRNASPFGAGWWVAGVERLHALTGGDKLWVGGDGSARVYAQVNDTTWAAANAVRPDTVKLRGGQHVRLLPGGGSVEFAASGLHVATENRVGHRTLLSYNGTDLTTITLPSQGGSQTYTFAYSAGALTSVTAPGGRVTETTVSGGQLTEITDPDDESVTFTYWSGTNRLRSRFDRRGTEAWFEYTEGHTLADSYLDLTDDTLRLGYWSVRNDGYAPHYGTVGRSAAATSYHLARRYATGSDYADQTVRFFEDGAGAPFQVTNPAGDATVYDRVDPQYPGVVTRTVHPNGWVLAAAYDGRGRVIAQTDSSTTARTRYTYEDTYDQVTAVIPPEGDRSDIGYDAAGNRIWQQDVRGPVSRATFAYYTSGDKKDLLKTVTAPDGGVTTLDYDGVETNVRTVTSPLGFVTTHETDDFGRDTLVLAPIDATHDREEHITYDDMDRVVETLSVGPSLSYQLSGRSPVSVPADSLTVTNTYDQNGNLTKVTQVVAPAPTGTEFVVTEYGYDRANRRIWDEDAEGRKQWTVYDPNGNATQTIMRRGDTVHMAYDVMDRLVERIVPAFTYGASSCSDFGLLPSCSQTLTVPAYPTSGTSYEIPGDTAIFTYDLMGNMLTAYNRFAQVERTYATNGSVTTDTLRLRDYAGTDFDNHEYGLAFGYDLNGRRTSLTHPTALRPTGASAQAYDYTDFGALQKVTSVLGSEFRFFYDGSARLDSLAYPGGFETRSYDLAGRLTERLEQIGTSVWHDDGFTYDRHNRILTATENSSSQFGWTVETAYSGLGSLVASDTQGSAGRVITEYTPDAVGRQAERVVEQGASDQVYDYEYDVDRLTKVVALPPVPFVQGWGPDTTFNWYDLAGNVERTRYTKYVPQVTSDSIQRRVSQNYYGADNKLMARQVNNDYFNEDGGLEGQRGVWEEYWYDALGRRVLLRARVDAVCTSPSYCTEAVTRTIWDGDQVLYEIRNDGTSPNTAPPSSLGSDYEQYGWVGYTHGPGIDAPLDLLRHEYNGATRLVIPHANWRGAYDSGTDSSGTEVGCRTYPASGGCLDIQYPASYRGPFHGDTGDRTRPEWFGSLIQDKKDQGGLMYMRNRYYDPSTGAFTQQDPIGLAGGLNLYGFANGDPVNFSDPFGLMACPPCIDARADNAAQLRRDNPKLAVATGAAIVTGGFASLALTQVALGGLVAAADATTVAVAGTGTALAQRGSPFSPQQTQALRDFFGRGLSGAQDRLANMQITPGITRDVLNRYGEVAQRAIDAGKDKLGVQAERLRVIAEALKLFDEQ